MREDYTSTYALSILVVHLSFLSHVKEDSEKEWRDRPDSNRGLPTPQAGALSRLDYGPIHRGAWFDL
jgi:hypothetical protein